MVGTMIAIEVPMQSCMRTSSGTPNTRKHFVQHRHDDRAAADAEQSGENAGDDAAGHDQQRKPDDSLSGTPSSIFAAMLSATATFRPRCAQFATVSSARSASASSKTLERPAPA